MINWYVFCVLQKRCHRFFREACVALVSLRRRVISTPLTTEEREWRKAAGLSEVEDRNSPLVGFGRWRLFWSLLLKVIFLLVDRDEREWERVSEWGREGDILLCRTGQSLKLHQRVWECRGSGKLCAIAAVFRDENTLGVQPVYVMCYQRNSWKDRSAKMTIISYSYHSKLLWVSSVEHKKKNLKINKFQNYHKISPCDLCTVFQVVWGNMTLIFRKSWHMCLRNEHFF